MKSRRHEKDPDSGLNTLSQYERGWKLKHMAGEMQCGGEGNKKKKRNSNHSVKLSLPPANKLPFSGFKMTKWKKFDMDGNSKLCRYLHCAVSFRCTFFCALLCSRVPACYGTWSWKKNRAYFIQFQLVRSVRLYSKCIRENFTWISALCQIWQQTSSPWRRLPCRVVPEQQLTLRVWSLSPCRSPWASGWVCRLWGTAIPEPSWSGLEAWGGGQTGSQMATINC